MKKLIQVVCIVMILIGSIFRIDTISAKETQFDIAISSSASLVKSDGSSVPLTSSTTIPSGSKLRIKIQIKNQSGTIESTLSLKEKEGFEFLTYTEGILSINGESLSKENYKKLIGKGYGVSLNSTSTTIEIEVKATKSTRGKISGDVIVASDQITVGDDKERYEQLFHGDLEGTSYHRVNFYDGTTLLESVVVANNQTVDIPNIQKEGHNLLGFNLDSDGSGTYYNGEKITASIDLYAVYNRKQFLVSYYIDENLYYQEVVFYGDNASYITPDEAEDTVFVGWDGELANIQNDTNVYALFEIAKASKSGLRYRIDVIIEGSKGIEIIPVTNQEYKETLNDFSFQIKQIANESLFNKLIISAIPLIVVLLIILIFLYFYKKSREGIRGSTK